MMINTLFNQNCVSDVKGGEAGHWTERSEGSGWSDSGTWNVATAAGGNTLLFIKFCIIFFKEVL